MLVSTSLEIYFLTSFLKKIRNNIFLVVYIFSTIFLSRIILLNTFFEYLYH